MVDAEDLEATASERERHDSRSAAEIERPPSWPRRSHTVEERPEQPFVVYGELGRDLFVVGCGRFAVELDVSPREVVCRRTTD
jgi:hypothetical protein